MCAKNQELVEAVVGKLTQMVTLAQAQAEARKKGERERAIELDKQLDLAYGEKERAVGAWKEHTVEHGC
jgi:hypothetical protein